MKIGGVDPKSLPNIEHLVLPRGDSNLVFHARGLSDMTEFEKLCPEPIPPKVWTKDGWNANLEDRDYLAIMAEFGKRRLAYMVVRSLEPSNVEWDTVKYEVPGTWANWEVDLRAANLSQIECNRILNLVLEANCLDESKLKKAREVFLRGPQQEPGKSTSPSTEPETSPSGEPVNG